MKRIVIELTDGKHINVEADTIRLRDDAVIAMKGEELAAYADLSVVLSAHVSYKEDQNARP